MDMYLDPNNLPQDGYRMFIFVPIHPFSYPENQNKSVKNILRPDFAQNAHIWKFQRI